MSAPVSNAFSVSDIDDSHGHRPSHLISNGNHVGMPDHTQQLHHLGDPQVMNIRDLEEVSREPSPGFDVLVDDLGRDSDYYAGDGRYGIPGEHEARDELDIGHSNDYYMISGIDYERYQDSVAYDPYEHRHRSSERYQALKHKRPSHLRSAVSHDRSHDIQIREKGCRDTHGNGYHTSLCDTSFGGRLRGRIELPTRIADHNGSSYFHGRMQAMMNSGIQQHFTNNRRDHGEFHGRRGAPFNNGDFPAPKSLSELKNGKAMESSGQRQTQARADHQFGKRKHVIHDEKTGQSDLSFEGPKSLLEILKRKRGESIGITTNISSVNDEVVVKDAVQSETNLVAVYEEEEKSDTLDSIPTDAGIFNSVLLVENVEDYDHNQEYEDDPESYGYQDTDDLEGNYTQDQHDDEDDDDFSKKMGVMYS